MKNFYIIIIIKNDTQNTILSCGSQHLIINKLNKNIINDSNICSSNLNKCKNEYKINHKSINNTTRNIFDYGKNNINNINNTKSENCRFSFSNYCNGSIIKEESKKNNQQESSNNYFNNYYKQLSILSKMTDNFSFKEEKNDFSNLIILLKNRNITEEEILSTKKLKIIGNPSDFFYDKEIIINAGGICKETIISNNKNENQYINNSPKQTKYENIGITYFGQNNINNNKNFVFMNYNREKFNDYNNTDIFFYIYYLRETKKYYLKPNINSIIFLKIKPKTPYIIKQGEFLGFDNAILMIRRNKSSLNNYLSIDYNQENFIFKDEDYINNNRCIKIGRDKNCDIVIENRLSISRINAIIKYNYKTEEWSIYDGDENNKPSLNGIRIMLKNQYEINENCDFEFLGKRFIVQLLSDDTINIC